MSDFEDKLNTILSDPDSMEQIMKLAQSLGGGQEAQEPHQEPESDMPDMSGLITLLASAGMGGESRYGQLLTALKPYLKEERRARLEKAMKISKLSKLARSALESGLIGEL